jgi:hypothetical protein
MTANELAEIIEDAYPRGFVKDAADMLRQQAKEIETLKNLLEEHPSWHGTQIYKQFLYLMQESE